MKTKPTNPLASPTRRTLSPAFHSILSVYPIPAVETVSAKDLDPSNRTQVAAFVKRVTSYVNLSRIAWEKANDRANHHRMAELEARELRMAKNVETLMSAIGVSTTWPGLYPAYIVARTGFAEHSTEAAVLAAFGHPRNWLSAKGGV